MSQEHSLSTAMYCTYKNLVKDYKSDSLCIYFDSSQETGIFSSPEVLYHENISIFLYDLKYCKLEKLFYLCAYFETELYLEIGVWNSRYKSLTRTKELKPIRNYQLKIPKDTEKLIVIVYAKELLLTLFDRPW